MKLFVPTVYLVQSFLDFSVTKLLLRFDWLCDRLLRDLGLCFLERFFSTLLLPLDFLLGSLFPLPFSFPLRLCDELAHRVIVI